jgi:hypothetical protein
MHDDAAVVEVEAAFRAVLYGPSGEGSAVGE